MHYIRYHTPDTDGSGAPGGSGSAVGGSSDHTKHSVSDHKSTNTLALKGILVKKKGSIKNKKQKRKLEWKIGLETWEEAPKDEDAKKVGALKNKSSTRKGNPEAESSEEKTLIAGSLLKRPKADWKNILSSEQRPAEKIEHSQTKPLLSAANSKLPVNYVNVYGGNRKEISKLVLASDHNQLQQALQNAGMNSKDADSAALNILTLRPASFTVKNTTKKLIDKLRVGYYYDFDHRRLEVMGYEDARSMMQEYDKMATQSTHNLFDVAHKHANDSKAVIKDANKTYHRNKSNAGEKRPFSEKIRYALTGSLSPSELVPDNSSNQKSKWGHHYKFDVRSAFKYKFLKKALKYPSKLIYKFKPYANVPMEMNLPNTVRLKDGDFAGKVLPAFNVRVGSVRHGEIDTILAASPAYHLLLPKARIDYSNAAASAARNLVMQTIGAEKFNANNMLLPKIAEQWDKFFKQPLTNKDDLKDLVYYLASKKGILPQNHITNSEILDIVKAMCLEYEAIQHNTNSPPKIGLQKGLKRYVFKEFARHGGAMANGELPEAMQHAIQSVVDDIRANKKNKKSPLRNLQDSLVAYVKDDLGKEIYATDSTMNFGRAAQELNNWPKVLETLMGPVVKSADSNLDDSSIEELRARRRSMVGLALNDLMLNRFRQLNRNTMNGHWYNAAMEYSRESPAILHCMEALRPIYTDIASLAAEKRYKKALKIVALRDKALEKLLKQESNPYEEKNDLEIAFDKFVATNSGDIKAFTAMFLRVWHDMQTGKKIDMTDTAYVSIYNSIRSFLSKATKQPDFLEQMPNFYSPTANIAELKELRDQCLSSLESNNSTSSAPRSFARNTSALVRSKFEAAYMQYKRQHLGKKEAGYENFVAIVSEVWNQMLLGQKVKNSKHFAKDAIEAMLEECNIPMPKDFLQQSGHMIKACPESTMYHLMSERDTALIKAFNEAQDMNTQRSTAAQSNFIRQLWTTSQDLPSLAQQVKSITQKKSWLSMLQGKKGPNMKHGAQKQEILTFWAEQFSHSAVPDVLNELPRIFKSADLGNFVAKNADTGRFFWHEKRLELEDQANNHPLEHWARMLYEANDEKIKKSKKIERSHTSDASDTAEDASVKKSKVFQIDFWAKDYIKVLSAQYPIVFYDTQGGKLVKLYPAPNNNQKMSVVADHGICLGADVNKILKDPQGDISDAIGIKNFIIETTDSSGVAQKTDLAFAFFANYQDYKKHDFSLAKMKPLVEWAENLLEEARQIGTENVTVVSNCHAGINRSQAALVLLDAIARKHSMLEEFKNSFSDKNVSDLDRTKEFINAMLGTIPSNVLASISHVTEQGNTMQYSQYRNLCTAMRLSAQNDLKQAGIDTAKNYEIFAKQDRGSGNHASRERSRNKEGPRDRQ